MRSLFDPLSSSWVLLFSSLRPLCYSGAFQSHCHSQNGCISLLCSEQGEYFCCSRFESLIIHELGCSRVILFGSEGVQTSNFVFLDLFPTCSTHTISSISLSQFPSWNQICCRYCSSSGASFCENAMLSLSSIVSGFSQFLRCAQRVAHRNSYLISLSSST
jgi:hypothetical protein